MGDGRLKSRRPGIAITHPTEVICRNAFMTNILLARGLSHARGKRPPAVEINNFSTYPDSSDSH